MLASGGLCESSHCHKSFPIKMAPKKQKAHASFYAVINECGYCTNRTLKTGGKMLSVLAPGIRRLSAMIYNHFIFGSKKFILVKKIC
ncbi:MAG: hypothetical protein QWI73_07020 [Alphaproteobacteria bacterium]|nr:hypothetical protein [Alphaproteobacteria bacterium]